MWPPWMVEMPKMQEQFSATRETFGRLYSTNEAVRRVELIFTVHPFEGEVSMFANFLSIVSATAPCVALPTASMQSTPAPNTATLKRWNARELRAPS
jgi:hypothetical protein